MNHLFNAGIISFEWVSALCWTLLHSIWQGMIAAALAGIIILCTKHSKAVIRYNLLCVVFTGFIVCSVYTFLHQNSFTIAGSSPVTVYRVDHFPNSQTSFIQETRKHGWSLQKERFLRPVIYYTNKYSSFIAGIWAIFFLIHFAKMIVGLRYVHNIRTKQTNTVNREWRERLFTISRMLGIRRVIGFKESALVKVPVVIGFLKPVILVPLGMFANLSAEQVETILVHELAHVRRRDFVVNLLQRFAEAIFFFNPFIAWISSRIREEREACCDDIVMEYTSDKKIYVEALVSFRQPDFALHGHAMALAGNNNLLNRVKRMITNENKKLNAMEKLTFIFVVLAVTAFSFIPARKNKTNQIALVNAKATVANPVDEVRIAAAKQSVIINAPIKKTDTIPSAKQLHIKSITQSFDDDSKGIEVKATDSDGKKYYYKKMNDELTELSVDAVKIDKQNMPRYKNIIAMIENAITDMQLSSLGNLNGSLSLTHDNVQLLNLKNLALQDQLLLANKNALQLNNINQFNMSNDSLLNFKNLAMQDQQLSLLKDQQRLSNNLSLSLSNDSLFAANNQLAIALAHANADGSMTALKGKLSALSMQDIQLGKMNSEITSIINDLANAGVLSDTATLSFSLTYDELIVNGKKQSKDLHEQLKKKYNMHPKDHFTCESKPGSRHTDINRE